MDYQGGPPGSNGSPSGGGAGGGWNAPPGGDGNGNGNGNGNGGAKGGPHSTSSLLHQPPPTSSTSKSTTAASIARTTGSAISTSSRPSAPTTTPAQRGSSASTLPQSSTSLYPIVSIGDNNPGLGTGAASPSLSSSISTPSAVASRVSTGNGALTAGVVILSIFVGVGIFVVAWYWFLRRRKSHRKSVQTSGLEAGRGDDGGSGVRSESGMRSGGVSDRETEGGLHAALADRTKLRRQRSDMSDGSRRSERSRRSDRRNRNRGIARREREVRKEEYKGRIKPGMGVQKTLTRDERSDPFVEETSMFSENDESTYESAGRPDKA